MTISASSIYLVGLQSERSKTVMESLLGRWTTILQGVGSHTELDWTNITYPDILQGINTLKGEGKAPTTLNNYIAVIKGVSKEAWKLELLSTRQYTNIKDIKRVAGSRTNKGVLLSKEDLRRLISSCVEDNTVLGARDSAIIALSYGAGLRRSESASLSLQDYNPSKQTVCMLGKGNKQMVNTLNDSTVEVVNNYLKVRGNKKGYLFLRGRRGNTLQEEGITDQAIYNMIVARCANLGLGKVSPHSLRKSFVTHLLENGEDLFTVADLARHADVSTTKGYDLRGDCVRVAAAKSLNF